MRRSFVAGLVGLGMISPRRVSALGTSGAINVKDYGAIGDGVADDTAALQAILDAAPARSGIYFPRGKYKVTSTLDCGVGSAAKGHTFYGDGQGKPGNAYVGGSVIAGVVDGPLMKTAYPASGVTFGDMGFANTHPAGIALQVGGNTITLERLSISGFKGIWAPENTFTMAIRSVQCVCAFGGVPLGSVGIQTSGHTLIHAADVVGFDHGIRACGGGVDMRSLRVEVNRTGLALGVDRNGNALGLTGATLDAVRLEANDIGVEFRAVSACSIRGLSSQGTTNAPSGMSRYGLLVTNAKWTEITTSIANGRYTESAIRISPTYGTQKWANVSAQNIQVGNPDYPNAKTWDIPNAANVLMEQCS